MEQVYHPVRHDFSQSKAPAAGIGNTAIQQLQDSVEWGHASGEWGICKEIAHYSNWELIYMEQAGLENQGQNEISQDLF